MHRTTAALTVALALLILTGTTAAAFTTIEDTQLTMANVRADGDARVNVYDYTRAGTGWTSLIISTVAEFNAVRPPTAPELIYVIAPGDADCLALTDDVWDLSGIVVCDTDRPAEYRVTTNTPAEGWSGAAQWRDDDTTVMILNNLVLADPLYPADYHDNTVCHELMHAYTRIHDAYDSDPSGSCVWGNLLAPGVTDMRLMRERYPETVEESSLWDRAKERGREAQEWACDSMSHVDISILWEDTRSTGREVRDRVSDVLPDVDIHMPDADIDLPNVDIDLPNVDINAPDVDIDLPGVNLPKCRTTGLADPS